MGSFPSPSRPTTPPPSPESNASSYRVLVAFCPKEGGSNTNYFNCIQCYNPSNNTWSHVSLIPDLLENHVLKGFAMVSLGESIYIVGGRLWNKRKPQTSSDSGESVNVCVQVSPLVLRYNVRLDQWSKCATLGVPRYDFACCVCDKKIYVAGGKSYLDSARGISSAERSSAEVFDTRTGGWDLAVGMWQLDVPPNQIVAVDGKLFSSGDCLKPWKGHIDVYDGKQNMWDEADGSRFQTLNLPFSTISGSSNGNWAPIERLYLTMAPIGTQLYFLAGYRVPGESPRTVSMVYAFDTSATIGAWKSLEPTEEEGEKELCSHCCVVQFS
ncbi:hypothetical protein ERO13_A05G163250v2 [Gossypium hirsutum]|uniref:Uncharacterized protein n=1 Tax=Gossypium barbadense TaxID=3634 RepID=A0A2P5X3N0_GOSBA|nr:hypothetical protein ERO13_A05G163250v2 [Gossypium hirsutum]PPR97928.1 hypothetical protein GOBAR_AA22745 [Gossypium barbadense]